MAALITPCKATDVTDNLTLLEKEEEETKTEEIHSPGVSVEIHLSSNEEKG
jgi:hypothetical protein